LHFAGQAFACGGALARPHPALRSGVMGIEIEERAPVEEPVDKTLRTVRDLRELMVAKIQTRTFSIADLCKLLQFEKELEKEQQTENIKEIKVTWVDQSTAESVSGQ
jgi:hypothetical protein